MNNHVQEPFRSIINQFHKGETIKIGDRVHVQCQDEEYGRIASDGEIVDVLSSEKDFGNNQIFLVSVDSVRANIVATKKEIRVL